MKMFKWGLKLLSVLKNVKMIFIFFNTDNSLKAHLNIFIFVYIIITLICSSCSSAAAAEGQLEQIN